MDDARSLRASLEQDDAAAREYTEISAHFALHDQVAQLTPPPALWNRIRDEIDRSAPRSFFERIWMPAAAAALVAFAFLVPESAGSPSMTALHGTVAAAKGDGYVANGLALIALADAGLPGIVTGIGYGDIAYSRRDGAGWTAPSNLTATPNADERFVSLAPSNPDNKLHLVFQASATDEAGVVTIGDRGFTNDLYVRRVAYLETPSGVGTSAPGVSTTPGRLSVSPNPSSGLVSFRLAGDVGSDQELRIYSLAGRRVASFRIDTDAVRWDGIGPGGAPVASGVYFAKLIGSAGPVTRFVIQR